jgi:hypothetical protein
VATGARRSDLLGKRVPPSRRKGSGGGGYGNRRAHQPPPCPSLTKEGNYLEHFHVQWRAAGYR